MIQNIRQGEDFSGSARLPVFYSQAVRFPGTVTSVYITLILSLCKQDVQDGIFLFLFFFFFCSDFHVIMSYCLNMITLI